MFNAINCVYAALHHVTLHTSKTQTYSILIILLVFKYMYLLGTHNSDSNHTIWTYHH